MHRELFYKFSTDPKLNNNLFNVFTYLLCNAAWNDFDELKRGQVKTRTKDIQEWMPHVKLTRIKHLICILVEKGFIRRVKMAKNELDFSIYEICHYDSFSDQVYQKEVRQHLDSGSTAVRQHEIDNTSVSLLNNRAELTQLDSGSTAVRQHLDSDECSYYRRKELKEEKEEKGKRATRTRHVNKSEKAIGKSVPVINAFVESYRNRYGQDPIINAAVRSQACKLVDSVGAERAIMIVETYLNSRDLFYLKKAHPFGLCLSDANKLNIEASRTVPFIEKPIQPTTRGSGLDSLNSYLDEMGVSQINEIPF